MANFPPKETAKTSQLARVASAPSKSPPIPERSYSLSKSSIKRDTLPLLPPPSEGDTEARLQVVMRELEEAKARTTQMEKTMRWWSDCTNNWREKWSKVRNEKNKIKEESKQLRYKLDTAYKDNINLKKEKDELQVKLDGFYVNKSFEDIRLTDLTATSSGATKSPDENTKQGLTSDVSPQSKTEELTDAKTKPFTDKDILQPTDTILTQKVAALQFKLEEAEKLLSVERKEKIEVLKGQEKLQAVLNQLQKETADLKVAKQDVEAELQQQIEQHQSELGRVTTELEDDFSSQRRRDQQLNDLRKELEKLQAENAKEWGKRERLESEKLSLERENKRLSSEAAHLQEELAKKNEAAASIRDGDLKVVQRELADRNKEIVDVRHSHSKAKKLLQEKVAELEHAKSRADQYEMEVKKLRMRVDELKQDLITSEDEVDQQANQIRRLQRTNDELQVQCENLQVQLEHLNTRLRSASLPRLSTRSESLKAMNLSGSTDCPTTDDDV